MGPIDFSPIAWLVVLGIVFLLALAIAAPFIAWWMWQHVGVVIR